MQLLLLNMKLSNSGYGEVVKYLIHAKLTLHNSERGVDRFFALHGLQPSFPVRRGRGLSYIFVAVCVCACVCVCVVQYM